MGSWEKLFEVESEAVYKHCSVFSDLNWNGVKHCIKCGELYDSEKIDQKLKELYTDNYCEDCIRIKKNNYWLKSPIHISEYYELVIFLLEKEN
jgi:hypothetical protein